LKAQYHDIDRSLQNSLIGLEASRERLEDNTKDCWFLSLIASDPVFDAGGDGEKMLVQWGITKSEEQGVPCEYTIEEAALVVVHNADSVPPYSLYSRGSSDGVFFRHMGFKTAWTSTTKRFRIRDRLYDVRLLPVRKDPAGPKTILVKPWLAPEA